MECTRLEERNEFSKVVRAATTDHWYKLLKETVDDRRYRAWAACVIWFSYTTKQQKYHAEFYELMDRCPGLGQSSTMCENKLWDYLNKMGIPSIRKKEKWVKKKKNKKLAKV